MLNAERIAGCFLSFFFNIFHKLTLYLFFFSFPETNIVFRNNKKKKQEKNGKVNQYTFEIILITVHASSVNRRRLYH